MKVPKYSHDKLYDPNATAAELQIAYDLSHAAATEQGYNPDNHVHVEALARRAVEAMKLETKRKATDDAEEIDATLFRLEASERKMRRHLPPVKPRTNLGHIAAVGKGLENTPTEVVVDTKTGLVLTPADIADKSI